MRYALVSDIHANLQAWSAVLEDMQALEIDQIINLGDVVGYGPSPTEVLASVRELSRISVIGNHDAVCAQRMSADAFNEQARAAIEWTQSQLDADACQFLEALPDMAHPEDESFLITHAEVVSPLDFGYILTEEEAASNFAACDDRIIFIGHTHRPGLFLQEESGDITLHEPGEFVCDPNCRYIINPGSVGDPRSEDIVASYCIFDSETRKVEFRRVEFDTDAYRSAIDASGLETRPFFLRYLDSLQEPGKRLIPPLAETSAMPRIDLSVKAPVLVPKKKMSPLVPIGLITLVIGCAGIAWIVASGRNQSAEETSNKPSDLTAELTTTDDASVDQTPEDDNTQITSQAEAPVATPAEPEVNSQFPVKARYVRIRQPNGPSLALAEVEVMRGKKNIALRRIARQSSTLFATTPAAQAVDGNRSGKKNNSISHTAKGPNEWWEVDLGEEQPITAVVVWNRNRSAPLMKRLDQFTLEIFDAERKLVLRRSNIPGKGYKIVLKSPPVEK